MISHPRPSIPINVQNSILTRVISILDGVSGYRDARGQENRKRKRPCKRKTTEKGGSRKKKRKVDAESIGHGMDLDTPADTANDQNSPKPATVAAVSSAPSHDVSQSEPPRILRHITLGINEVTKRLESQVRRARRTVIVAHADAVESSKSRADLKIIFVCRADIDPPLLIEHLPYLVAAFNSAQLSVQMPEPVKVVPLPNGAEFTLARALGLRRVAVMAIDVR
jgi:ribonuclease P/MRP protein subunit POP3